MEHEDRLIMTPNELISWHHLCFRFHVDDEPRFFLDLAVIDLLLWPAMKARLVRPGLIKQWRFHRRYEDDKTGHQLSLIVKTNPDVARTLFDNVHEQDYFKWMEDDGLIIETSFIDKGKRHRSDVADPGWPRELQDSWGFFAQGASKFLAILVDNIVDGRFPTGANEIVDLYCNVEVTLGDIWSRYGQHAFFHHISAMFGYMPLVIKKEVTF